MNLYFFDDESIIMFNLPVKKIGNYWLTDSNGKNVININGEDGKWVATSAENVKIITQNEDEDTIIEKNCYYLIEKNNRKYVIYSSILNDETFVSYEVLDKETITVGKNESCKISINLPYLMDNHFTLQSENDTWKINVPEGALVYVNNNTIKGDSTLKNGDVINTFGFKVVLVKNCIFINAPFNKKPVSKLKEKTFSISDEIVEEEIENKDIYDDSDYFLRSPRMRKIIERLDMRIDSPPQKENMQETPLIMTLAPMLTMAASSVLTLTTALQSVSSGERTWKQVIPTLIISAVMIFSMFVWPFVTREYEKKQKKKREEKRQERYRNYLGIKKGELQREFDGQRKTLEENLVSTDICYDSIINKRRTLWQRRKDQGDFLTVRIGKGSVPFEANINYSAEEFTMEDDDLKRMLESLTNEFKTLENVPIGYSFTDNHLTAVNGLYPKYLKFLNNVFLQLMDFHSYQDLKIVVFTNKKNAKRWEYLKESPYCFSDDKYIRFFATTTEEMQEISEYLLPRFQGRVEYASNANNLSDFSKYSSYYLILIDNIDDARKIDIINKILEDKRNLGFSIILAEEKLSKLPSEISRFITIGDSASAVLYSENNNQIRFTDEINDTYDMMMVARILSNVPLFIDEKIKQLPSTITFLELYGVGQIEQLNVLNRWKDNDPVKSLKVEVGVNENGDPFIIDLHEKSHGPHGLIAGMTGSGKSEFIITYILSMAINYSPEEVSFVLIDYKGGGLAGAFVNSETGQKLPHIVGTITNLDKTEINRALSSIQSELRRRQEKFNEVRDKLGESTIDIYKYQKLYREGIINEPISHLIIVCDEFAELKDQQPDFMEDLISTARIGRSLGVHLILATQKPSGVVDAQIWSNAKFKICLKVQDRSDSMEMIKSDAAAELKNVGRFYLLVGYNEYFALGQAAWAGAQYYPNKEFKKITDKNMYFIDNIGSVKKTIYNTISRKNLVSQGEELTNIVKYLIDISGESNFKINPLWLDRLSDTIMVDALYKKYNYIKQPFNINPIIGEYDDPYNQSQGLLTLPIGEQGNAIIYGTNESGKDELLSTFVYSSLMIYDTSELNMYLVDFGAELLQNYESAPQVGNSIINGEDEKLENLAKMLFSEMNKRKKIFSSFNGNYDDYIRSSGEKIPNIIVVINAIDALNELYPDYLETITPIIREGTKYGINFVITATSQTSVKYRISQSCKQTICLQMKNESDYKDILGKTNGIIPSAFVGRGLVKLDHVVEFQTAIIDKENAYLKVKELIASLNEKGINRAREIPVMPEKVKISLFSQKYLGIDTVPIGLTKETLNAQLYDFKKNVVNLISSSDMDNISKFVNNFINTLASNTTFNTMCIDASNYFEKFDHNVTYVNNSFNEFINSLSSYDKKLQDILISNNMNIKSLSEIKNNLAVIVGFDKFYNKLDEEHKTIFKEILDNQREVLKLTFVFIDIPSSFKKYEYEEWYKNNINNNDGIWVGKGIGGQYTIKISIQPSGINAIDDDYAVVVKNGMPTVIKTINEE
ncbi:MAG: type VII secretion protein EssC [Bacilli bacterium]|nr:type VII secretion protein EssC [Bacilli bacterium]